MDTNKKLKEQLKDSNRAYYIMWINVILLTLFCLALFMDQQEYKTQYTQLVNSLHTEPALYNAGFRTTADYKDCETITDTTKRMECYGFKIKELPIPNSNKVCTNPTIKDGYYYCNVEDIKEK